MKRLFLSYLAFLTSALLVAQVDYIVKVNCTDAKLNATMLYLVNSATKIALDSARVEQGKAGFVGSLTEPTLVALCASPTDVRKDDILALILDGTPITTDYLTGIIEASEQNLRLSEYQKKQRAIMGEMQEMMVEARTLHKELNGQIPQDKMEVLKTRYDALDLDYKQLLEGTLEENRDNMVPLLLLSAGGEQIGYEQAAEYLKTYKYSDNAALASLKETLAKEALKFPGAKVADFEMKDLSGNTVCLTDYVGKGNYVLVDFWASWCGPCRMEMPNVKAEYEKYHPKGFEVVGVSLDRNKEAWQKGVADLGITWPQMSDLKYWQCEGARIYNIRAIPATILFAPDGRVVKSGLRGEELSKKLSEIYE